ncbi:MULTISPECIES: SRPBCC family protein [Protofrankia]|uniref:Dimethyladenosine transferase n=1 Tax=Protofrankia coriariae TaxID=1562887 RepID=A0ABR5F543_9ACTN|nr:MULTISPECIES: SRPBCC family protein [Protofrankia]KLL11817.1 dimethyladenosine transferase [Protofrankia coriariae]ONH36891.1 dimethyladenosine transferase [Protofrankia sp. BMG5.30]
MAVREIAATRTIPATAEQIFGLLADPAQHPVIDGSGTVRAVRPGGARRLTLGSKFGMDMRMGVPYRIENTVVEFEENRLITWRHFFGHRWRWLLTPLPDGRTEVTETFDWSTARIPWLIDVSPFLRKNRAGIEKSLERLAGLFSQ